MAKFDLLTTLSLNAAGFTQGIDRAKKSTQGFQSMLKGIGGMAAGFLTVGAAVEFAKKAIDASQGSADKFERIMGGVNTTTDRFFNMISTGDFSNLIDNLTKAAEAGTDYADAIDEINERKLGLDLEASVVSPYQKELEATFRDKENDPEKRQEALNVFRNIGNDIATKGISIANAAVIAQENLLKGKGVEASKLKELFMSYNTNITTIQSANEKTAKLNELWILRERLLKNTNSVTYTEDLKRNRKALDDFYASMTEDEKYFADLIRTNDKTKETDLTKYLEVLKLQGKAEEDLASVKVETLKIGNQITKAVEEELAAELAATEKISILKGLKKTDIKQPFVNGGNTGQFTLDGSTVKTNVSNELVKMNTDKTMSQIIYNNSLQDAIVKNEELAAVEERKNKILLDGVYALGGGASSIKEYGKQVMNTIRSVISALLAETIATAIAKSMRFAKNPFIGLALGAITGGLAASLFNTIVPAFANGGISSGGMALVGERGPELVNLPSGSQVFSNSQSSRMFGGGGEVLIKFQNGSLEAYMDYNNRKSNSFR